MKLELRSVRIKNCGPIDDIKLDFFDATGKTLPVCVIGGTNGSGKTTILEVIASLLIQFEGRDTGRSNKRFFVSLPDTYIQADFRFGELDVSLFRGPAIEDAKLCNEYWGQRFIKISEGTYDAPIERTDQAIQLQQAVTQQRNNPTTFSPSGPSSLTYIPSLIFLPHNRSLEPVYGQEIRREEDRYEFVYRFESIRQFPGSLTSYLIWLDYAESERYAQIQQFLNDLDFDGKTFRVDRKSLSVVVKTASGHEHPLHELSSGEQNLLIILIELRRKLTPGSIVLIDEIENSLHPAFQHRLAQGLLALQREVPYQLIVTTHAPAFVEIFGAENTRLLTAF